MTNQRFRVQKLPIRNLYTLHQHILPAELTHARQNTPIIQRPPRELTPFCPSGATRLAGRLGDSDRVAAPKPATRRLYAHRGAA